MSKEIIIEALKSRNFKVAELADLCGITKQTLYNYAKYYDDGEFDKIPTTLKTLISMCLSEETTQEDIDKYWSGCTARIRTLMQDREYAEIDKDNLSKLIDFAESNEKISKEMEESFELNQLIQENKLKIEECETRIESIENRIKREQLNLMSKSSSDSPADEVFKIGPNSDLSWTDVEVRNACISDSGRYTIFVDPECNSDVFETIVRLYASIGGSKTYLKSYLVNRGENMIQIDLVPKVNYYYQVIQTSPYKTYQSDMKELKN